MAFLVLEGLPRGPGRLRGSNEWLCRLTRTRCQVHGHVHTADYLWRLNLDIGSLIAADVARHLVAVGGDNPTLRNRENGKVIAHLPTRNLCATEFGRNALIVATDDQRLQVWQLPSPEPEGELLLDLGGFLFIAANRKFETTTPLVTLAMSLTCAVHRDGTVACWGQNDYGELGDGTTTDRLASVLVVGFSNAVSVAVGRDHSCAKLRDGNVRCWGKNDAVQLGNGAVGQVIGVIAPLGLPSIRKLSMGASKNYAVSESGKVFTWGGDTIDQIPDE